MQPHTTQKYTHTQHSNPLANSEHRGEGMENKMGVWGGVYITLPTWPKSRAQGGDPAGRWQAGRQAGNPGFRAIRAIRASGQSGQSGLPGNPGRAIRQAGMEEEKNLSRWIPAGYLLDSLAGFIGCTYSQNRSTKPPMQP